MTITKFIVIAIIGYLLGSVNTSLVVGKFYSVDVRKHGSGNAGITNTYRTLGKSAALFVLVGDVLKGVLSCLLGYLIAGKTGAIVGGGFSIIGHNWPLYFGFKGGKGVLTSFAVMVFIDWKLAGIVFIVFLIIFLLTKYVSLSSIIGALALPITAILLNRDLEVVIFSVLLSLILIARHHSNIERLLKRTEPKFSRKAG